MFLYIYCLYYLVFLCTIGQKCDDGVSAHGNSVYYIVDQHSILLRSARLGDGGMTPVKAETLEENINNNQDNKP
eukprot:UN14864